RQGGEVDPPPGATLVCGRPYLRLAGRPRPDACALGCCGLCGRPRELVTTTVTAMTDEWTAPPVERSDPGRIMDERKALEAWLDFHRETLLQKCSGLTASQLKERAVPPSRLSLLGLVRHMTEVERWWFRIHAANTDMSFPYD